MKELSSPVGMRERKRAETHARIQAEAMRLFLERSRVRLPRPLIALYTTDAEVMAVAPGLLVLAAAFQIFDGVQTVSTGALRGLGETRVPMIANLVGYWVIGLPLGLTLCFVWKRGIYGLWIGLTLALVVIASMLLVRWNRDSRAVAVGGP